MRTTLPEPWLSFLRELDPIAGEPTKIPCIGGFAVTQYYGSVRTTVAVGAKLIRVQGNRISKQLQESDKKGIVPSGAFEFSA